MSAAGFKKDSLRPCALWVPQIRGTPYPGSLDDHARQPRPIARNSNLILAAPRGAPPSAKSRRAPISAHRETAPSWSCWCGASTVLPRR